jgi:8-oxo-dGTP pyrophosphatase MutT (NUDIX family)
MAHQRDEDFSGWPERGHVFPVSSLDLRVVDGPHSFCASDAHDIAANWRREITANPALFDGPMVFYRSLNFRDGAIDGQAHIVPYSTFLWWRRKTDRSGASHLFCYPVLVSADGALVAIKMSQHTANPGQVYFAAGSLEAEDVKDGRCDTDGNMAREVMEETGFDLSACASGTDYFGVRLERTVCLFKLFHFDKSAVDMIAHIEEHMQVTHDQEISAAVAIRSADPNAHPYNPAMLPIIDWFFAGRR